MTKPMIGAAVIAAAAIVGVLLLWQESKEPTLTANLPTPAENGNVSVPLEPTSHSDGTISFTVPDGFGLAVTADQILTRSVIPPCEAGFKYCLYHLGTDFVGSTFESAGVSIRERAELTTQDTCLRSPPAGYAGQSPATATRDTYAVSAFTGLGDAATGHYASGDQYRLFTEGECYQFDTRVGWSQVANYPEGTVTEFTEDQRDDMAERLRDLVEDIRLMQGDEPIRLP